MHHERGRAVFCGPNALKDDPRPWNLRSIEPFRSQLATEVIPENVGAVVLTQVKELSLHGCYLEFANQLEKGMHVVVKIFAGSNFFEANANVIYSQPILGTCLVFRDLKPHFAQVLQKWLLQAMKAGKSSD